MEPIIGNTYMTNSHEGLVHRYKNQPFYVVTVDKGREVLYIKFDDPILASEYATHHLTFDEWKKYVNVTVEPQRNLNKLSFLYNGI